MEKTDEKKRIVSHMIDKMRTRPDFIASFRADPEESVRKASEELKVEPGPELISEIKDRMLEEADKRLIVTHTIGKMQTEPDFLATFTANPIEAVRMVGLELNKPLDAKQGIAAVEEVQREAQPLPFLTRKEMMKLLEEMRTRAASGYEKSQLMSSVLFGVGLLFVVAVFFLDVYGILVQVNWASLVVGSGVIGSIGVESIWQSTNRIPGTVKTTEAELFKLNVCFLGFLDQLSVLMGHEGKSIDEATKIAEAIDRATKETVRNISDYCGGKEAASSGSTSLKKPSASPDKPKHET